MAITNAQQYKQLLAKGGRIGFQGGGKDLGKGATGMGSGKSKNMSPRRSMSQFGHAGHAGKTEDQAKSDQRSGKDTPNAGAGSDPFAGHNQAEKKGFQKQQEINKQIASGTFKTPAKSNFFKDLITNRRKQAYNLARSLPGAKKSSFNNLVAYRNYLKSQGADLTTIDRLLEGVDEETPIGFDAFQELAYGYEPKGITDIDKLRGMFTDPTRGPFEKLTAVPQNFPDFMLTQRNNPNLFAKGDLGNFMDKPKPKDLVNPNTGELYTNAEWNALKQDIGQDRGLMRGDGENQITDPCKGPNPPAYCNVGNDDDNDDTTNPTQLLSSRIIGSQFDPTFFAAEGGRIGAMDGGIMNIEDLDREAFFLGGIAKGIKKAVRGVKKLAKSPIGKMALTAAAIKFGGGLGGLKGKLFGLPGVDEFGGTMGLFGKLGLTEGFGGMMPTLKGGIALTSILPLLAGKTDEEKDDILKNYYASQELIPSTTKRQMGSEFDFYKYNLAEGGMPSKEPVAKKVMPLLDMDGMEKDYRAEGGFVPIGRMEKADDVPARLSKNEFVFTADAVRNAGEGDVDKGAEVMYNMMKNLESGGEISEESQGLDGAREMFQTSQRLGEVI